MDALITFLRARLDEREASANSRYTMRPDGPRNVNADRYPDGFLRVYVDGGPPTIMSDQQYVEAFMVSKPDEKLLIEVNAQRRIIDKLTAMLPGNCYCSSSGSEHHNDAEELLKLLAVPFAGHPDYREDWKP